MDNNYQVMVSKNMQIYTNKSGFEYYYIAYLSKVQHMLMYV